MQVRDNRLHPKLSGRQTSTPSRSEYELRPKKVGAKRLEASACSIRFGSNVLVPVSTIGRIGALSPQPTWARASQFELLICMCRKMLPSAMCRVPNLSIERRNVGEGHLSTLREQEEMDLFPIMGRHCHVQKQMALVCLKTWRLPCSF